MRAVAVILPLKAREYAFVLNMLDTVYLHIRHKGFICVGYNGKRLEKRICNSYFSVPVLFRNLKFTYKISFCFRSDFVKLFKKTHIIYTYFSFPPICR